MLSGLNHFDVSNIDNIKIIFYCNLELKFQMIPFGQVVKHKEMKKKNECSHFVFQFINADELQLLSKTNCA